MIKVTEQEFEQMVADGIDALPEDYIKQLDNVVIVAEKFPSRDQLKKSHVHEGGLLFGLYEGIPKTARTNSYSGHLPDKISIFQEPLSQAARNKQHLKLLVKNTVWHEVAHHYGLEHGRIHYLEYKRSQGIAGNSKPISFETAKSLDAQGVSHGWFRRHGGVSTGPFGSLNVKHRLGDRVEFVEENRRRALFELNRVPDRMIFANDLAHHNRVFVATAKDAGTDIDDYDAIVTNVVDLPIALSVADCTGLFLFDPKNKAVAVVHVGWRGVLAEVAIKTLTEMTKQYGTVKSDVIAALGPSIAQENYEVGSEVAAQFDDDFVLKKGGSLYLNVAAALRQQLEDAGISHIEQSKIDTFSDHSFYSYRRDGYTGRDLAVISL